VTPAGRKVPRKRRRAADKRRGRRSDRREKSFDRIYRTNKKIEFDPV
jgi:hypothetical protein